MTWGFRGFLERLLEIPDFGGDAEVAPLGRARIRYVESVNELQLSRNGGAYEVLAPGQELPAGEDPNDVLVVDGAGNLTWATIVSDNVDSIDGTKIVADFGAQNITTSGAMVFGGDATLAPVDRARLRYAALDDELQVSLNGGAFDTVTLNSTLNERTKATFSTADATPVALASVTIPAGQSRCFTITVRGTSAAGDSFGMTIMSTFENTGGVVSEVLPDDGSDPPSYMARMDTNVVLDFTIAGDVVSATFTGTASPIAGSFYAEVI